MVAGLASAGFLANQRCPAGVGAFVYFGSATDFISLVVPSCSVTFLLSAYCLGCMIGSGWAGFAAAAAAFAIAGSSITVMISPVCRSLTSRAMAPEGCL